MLRRPYRLVALTAAAAALAACTSTTSRTPTPTSGGGQTSTVSRAQPSSAPLTTSKRPSPTPSPRVQDFGSAQPAVTALIRTLSAYSAAVRAPSRASTASFDKYLSGPAMVAFDSAFAAAKKAGVAYRGTPPAARIKVVSNKSSSRLLPEVVLINCPAISPSPFTAYYTRTGKAVPTARPKILPPYAQTAKVFRLNGRWIVTSFSTNAAKTCHP
jgi:hypothetical protein